MIVSLLETNLERHKKLAARQKISEKKLLLMVRSESDSKFNWIQHLGAPR